MSNVLPVAAAIIQVGDRVLACRRRPGKAASGKWEFPGGKLEKGESAESALRREIAEELDTEIRVLGELTTSDTVVGDTVIRLICLRAEVVSEMPQASSDHDCLEWVPIGELRSLEWAAPDLPAVDLLIATVA